MTTMDEVRAFIGKDADAAQLHELASLIRHAERARGMALPPGTRARIVEGLRPKYLVGLTGTVKGTQGERVLFEPDVPQPRFGAVMRLPAGTVVPL